MSGCAIQATPLAKPQICQDMDLFKTAKCLKTELSTFYDYNISNKGKVLTDQELKTSGGVCSHYAEWYTDKAIELGFHGNTVIFGTGENSAHAVSIISNGAGYCVLDQRVLKCTKF